MATKPSEQDPSANYVWVFSEEIPTNVTLVNFAATTYSREVYGDIFEGQVGEHDAQELEFELIVPREWVETKARRFALRSGLNDFVQYHATKHLARAPKWGATNGLSSYVVFTDATRARTLVSGGDDPAGGRYYMFVANESAADGRVHVFFCSTVIVGGFHR